MQCTTSSSKAFVAPGSGRSTLRQPAGARSRHGVIRCSAAAEEKTVSGGSASADPLLLRAARKEEVHRPPVWMMRQAGRYMKIYQDLCKKPGCDTFRLRSETVELATEISLQPWNAFKPDGIILFSDILTPLAGMNVPFDIVAGVGPVIHDPIRNMEALKSMRPLEPEESMSFVGQTLQNLRQEVGNQATVLGFVGAPFSMATYIIEGGTTKYYQKTKDIIFTNPELLKEMCSILADSLADYIRYQADNGAQVVQIFDSWAGNLSPVDYDVFGAPYIKRMVDSVKETHPDLPIILYIAGSGGLIERMALTGVDIVSVDQSHSMADAIKRIGAVRSDNFGVQGNLDPCVLFSEKDVIERRVIETVKAAQGTPHIMNLGHGVMQQTPEDNVAHFFEVCKTVEQRM